MMRSSSLLLSLFTAVLIAATPAWSAPPGSDREKASRLLTIAGEGFRTLETDHFIIAYDTSYEALRPLLGRLEGTYDAILRFLSAGDLTGSASPQRMEVILFDRHEDFARYLAGIGMEGGSVAGIYDQQANVAAFCNMAHSPGLQQIALRIEQVQDQLRRSKRAPLGSQSSRQRRKDLQNDLASLRMQRDALVKRFNRFVVQHEAAHQMFFNLGLHVRGADNPTWLVEGLACQFEVPQVGPGHPLTRINHFRLADFRDAFHVAPKARTLSDEAFAEALADGNLVPLVDLLCDPSVFNVRGTNRALRYAQAWALVHYLNRKHRDAFMGYLTRLKSRPPGRGVERLHDIGEFRSAFGEPDEAFQRAWIGYMFELRLNLREAGR